MLPYPDPPLADELVELRPWRHDDVHVVEQASRDPNIPRGTTVPEVYSPEEGAAWIDRQLMRATAGEGISLAMCSRSDGVAAGLVVLLVGDEPDAPRLGYWVVPGARGRGLASHAVELVSSWALDLPAIERIVALVEPWNVASMRVLQRAGFERGKTTPSPFPIGGQTVAVVRYVRHSPSET